MTHDHDSARSARQTAIDLAAAEIDARITLALAKRRARFALARAIERSERAAPIDLPACETSRAAAE